MTIRFYVAVLITCLCCSSTHAQENKDILWRKYVLRTIDLVEKANAPLNAIYDSTGTDLTLSDVLVRLVQDKKVRPCDLEGNSIMMSDSMQMALEKQGRFTRFMLYEEWYFSRDSGKMYVRPLLIGPYDSDYARKAELKKAYDSLWAQQEHDKKGNTKLTERAQDCLEPELRPVFYISVGDAKPWLEKYHMLVQVGHEHKALNVIEYLDTRKFASLIVCIKGHKPSIEEDKDHWEY